MDFGNADFTLAQVKRRLQPGTVVKFMAEMDDGLVHEKRYVVLDVENDTLTCVMNSEINKFILARPAILKCQVKIPVVSHDFMDHDSHIDCSHVRAYPTDMIINQLCKNPKWILGTITDVLRHEICAGLKSSSTTAPAITRQCCSSLENADL